jgi:hypothetical protein
MLKFMKKVLLTITAGLLIGFGAFAQTIVSMPWNQYAGAPKIEYQGKDATKVSTYVPAVGDVVTVTIAGTSDQNITGFQMALVDDAAPSYWTELAGFKPLGTGSVTAGVAFSFTVDLAVTATGTPKIVFGGTNATFAGADGTGTAISLNLSTYTVSVFKPIAGATILTDNGNGAKQVSVTKLDAATTVKAGDVVHVTLKGISDVDATEFQVVVVDESADASTPYWTPLSAITDFTPAAVTANQTFDLGADITITAAPVGTGVKLQNIVLMAKTTSGLIQLSLTDYTAVIVPAGSVDKSALTTAIAAATTKVGAATEGTAAGNYAVGSKATLTTAIATAQSASDAATTAGEVTAALTALNTAVAAFEAGKVGSGSDINDITEGSIAIVVINGVVTVNASDVSSIKIATIAGSVVANNSNVSGLAKGTYVATITFANGTVVSKTFIK